MNEQRIRECYPPGDPEAEMLVSSARQLNEMFEGSLAWSLLMGRQLAFLLSFARFEFPDKTVLGEATKFETIIGNVEAAMILAAIDPDDRGYDFWRWFHLMEFSDDEKSKADAQLRRAMATAGILLGD